MEDRCCVFARMLCVFLITNPVFISLAEKTVVIVIIFFYDFSDDLVMNFSIVEECKERFLFGIAFYENSAVTLENILFFLFTHKVETIKAGVWKADATIAVTLCPITDFLKIFRK